MRYGEGLGRFSSQFLRPLVSWFASLAVLTILTLPAGICAQAVPSQAARSADDVSVILLADASSKIQQCNACCAGRQSQCYAQQSRPVCDAQFSNCIATCTSQGQTPSDWGASCWGSGG